MALPEETVQVRQDTLRRAIVPEAAPLVPGLPPDPVLATAVAPATAREAAVLLVSPRLVVVPTTLGTGPLDAAPRIGAQEALALPPALQLFAALPFALDLPLSRSSAAGLVLLAPSGGVARPPPAGLLKVPDPPLVGHGTVTLVTVPRAGRAAHPEATGVDTAHVAVGEVAVAAPSPPTRALARRAGPCGLGARVGA